MLTHIQIKNFAIIEELDLELGNHLSVFTGETGAGKSIIIGAIELALGGRSETQVIRPKAERCEITLSFAVGHNHSAQEWLVEHEMDSDNECIIRRVINKEGRSRTAINAQHCPQQLVRELGSLLVNIHGQHQHQLLLRSNQQRILLDHFAKLQTLTEKISILYQQWHAQKNQLTQLLAQHKDHAARTELLCYQVLELDQLMLGEQEFSQLEQEYKQLANIEQIINKCHSALELVCGDEEKAAATLLHKALEHTQAINAVEPQANNVIELLNNAIIQTQEAGDELHNLLQKLDANPERLHQVEQRLNTIYDLARKHHVDPEQLYTHHQRLKQELQNIQGADNKVAELTKQVEQLQTDYSVLAEKLSKSRSLNAKKLSDAVTSKIQQLGMPKGIFKVCLESNQTRQPTPYGHECAEFKVAINPGQTLQALNKVASGGELSRISLAIHVITAEQGTTPTLIFDEVDVGIGGSIAEIIGQLLHKLGETCQVLCITHLPQVAAQGHQHHQVKKVASNKTTSTYIVQLKGEEKIAEIARMLAGINITQRSLDHAREMVEMASND